MMLIQGLLIFTHVTLLFALTIYYLMVLRNQYYHAASAMARGGVFAVIIAWIPAYMGFLNFFFEPFQWGYYEQKGMAAGITMFVYFIVWWIYRKQYARVKSGR